MTILTASTANSFAQIQHRGSPQKSLDKMFEEAELTGILQLSGRKLKEFPCHVSAKHDLTDTIVVDLSENGLNEVPTNVCDYGYVQALRLDGNCVRSLTASLQLLNSLTYLDISRNQLSCLPVSLFTLPLEVLLISQNHLEYLPREIRLMAKTLTELDLSCNRLSYVPPDLGFVDSLRVLNLRNNLLTDLPSELCHLRLRVLNISSNRLSQLPHDLRFMSSLIELILDENPLIKPPTRLCSKGLVHVFKWLEADITWRSQHKKTLEWPANRQPNGGPALSSSATLGRTDKTPHDDYKYVIEKKVERRNRAARHNTIGADSGYASIADDISQQTMTCSDVPGMTMEAVSFVKNNLMLNLSEEWEARAQLTRMIEESLKSHFPRLNFAAHALAQIDSLPKLSSALTGTASTDPNRLSFINHLFTQETDGQIKRVDIDGCEKWHMPEKVYMYKIAVQRKHTVLDNIYRSFDEFHEFYMKLRHRFPFFVLTALSKGAKIARTNVREVAERRTVQLKLFLQDLFDEDKMTAEISHCDLVYTFFHPIMRDSAPDTYRTISNNFETRPQGLSTQQIGGEVGLKLTYGRGVLNVVVGHAKRLPTVSGNNRPDVYVKCYLKPEPSQRHWKRKTRIIRKSQNPTFNETLTYQVSSDRLACLTLDISVWHCVALKENCYLGGILIPMCRLSRLAEDDRGRKVMEEWFSLANTRCLKFGP